MINKSNIRKGVILIADFSGFTEFVYNTQPDIGETITRELLSALIDANGNNFYVSEIEGDAVLFYNYQKRPCYVRVMELLYRLAEVFNDRLSHLERDLDVKTRMSLKFIVHHGEFSRYMIRGFKKLYGRSVVEVHKLLKNEFAVLTSYILLTSQFLIAAKKVASTISDNESVIEGVGQIYYLKK
ncbi:MAG: DUF2652 domain-containing protein [Pedobacter sp.]|nr:MAG: DUF2652 domain-containing protein [Pedobacter sp.]